MAQRTMGEVAAWNYLAAKWDKPVIFNGVPSIRLGGRPWYRHRSGLCDSIDCLHWWGKRISFGTACAMGDQMYAYGPKGGKAHGYWWPRTLAGAKRRAAFCRRMAKLAAAKEKAAPKKKKA